MNIVGSDGKMMMRPDSWGVGWSGKSGTAFIVLNRDGKPGIRIEMEGHEVEALVPALASAAMIGLMMEDVPGWPTCTDHGCHCPAWAHGDRKGQPADGDPCTVTDEWDNDPATAKPCACKGYSRHEQPLPTTTDTNGHPDTAEAGSDLGDLGGHELDKVKAAGFMRGFGGGAGYDGRHG